MSRQIRPLDLITPLKLLKLGMIPHDRRANIARLPRLRTVTILRIVARQRIAPPQMETPSPRTTGPPRSAGRRAVVQHGSG